MLQRPAEVLFGHISAHDRAGPTLSLIGRRENKQCSAVMNTRQDFRS